MKKESTPNTWSFMSSETLLMTQWISLMDEYIINGAVQLVVVDEVQLFVELGISFCTKFFDLKEYSSVN